MKLSLRLIMSWNFLSAGKLSLISTLFARYKIKTLLNFLLSPDIALHLLKTGNITRKWICFFLNESFLSSFLLPFAPLFSSWFFSFFLFLSLTNRFQPRCCSPWIFSFSRGQDLVNNNNGFDGFNSFTDFFQIGFSPTRSNLWRCISCHACTRIFFFAMRTIALSSANSELL